MILFVTFVIVFLILVNAFYVAAEFAAVSVRRNMIREMAENGSRVAVQLLKILENTKELDRYIAACQFGITISSLVLGAYGQVELAAYLFPLFERFGGMDSVMANSAAALVVLIGLTVFQVILGELMPKSLALQFPKQAALYTYYPMRWTQACFAWFIDFLNGSGLLLLKLFRLPPGGHQHIHSQQEINMLLDESHQGGMLEEDEHERLHSALSLAERTVEQIMIPRFQLVCLDADATQEDILDMIADRPHTHIPVYEGSRESVIGMLHIKDMVAAYAEKGILPPLRSMLRQVPCVMEMQTVEMLMARLREDRAKEAFVLDEYGKFVGLVTLERLLGEMVGDIDEEFIRSGEKVENLPDG
ncbi:hemolysin family protein, partial [uncultured Akkermansia sp.]